MPQIQDGDVLPLYLVALIFYWVGKRATTSQPSVRTTAWKIATVVFVGVTVLYAMDKPTHTAADLLSSTGMGLIGGALVLGPSLIVVSVLKYICSQLGRISRTITARRAAELRRQQEKIEHQRRLHEEERLRPERERQSREAEARRRATEMSLATAKKRREEALASCELLYDLHATEIGHRFPRTMFKRFVSKYMTDTHSPDDVERRAAQLRELIEAHCRTVKPVPTFATTRDLNRWYEEQKADIESMPSNEDDSYFRETYLIELRERYAELRSALLQNTQL